MYGYNYAFLRDDEAAVRRIQSVPVLTHIQQQQQMPRRANSLSGSSSIVLDERKGRISFSDYLAEQREPLLIYQPSKEEQIKASSFIPIVLTLLVGQGALLFGFHIGYSSPTEVVIRNRANITRVQSDFMFSLLSIGAIFGCLLTAPIAQRMGRKPTILVSVVPFIVGSAIMCNFPSYFPLCVGRLICGFGVGLASVFVPLYIAETAPTHLRGSLGSANQFLIAFGIVLVNAVGLPILDNSGWWRWMLILSAIPLTILFFGILFLGVETPRWLLAKGEEDLAESALRFIRGPDYDISIEMNDVIQWINRLEARLLSPDPEEYIKIEEKVDVDSYRYRIKYLLTEGFRPFMIGITLQLLQQWSGINAIMFHTSSLFVPNATDNPTREEMQTGLYGAIAANGIQVLMCGVTVLVSSIFQFVTLNYYL